MKKNKPCSPQEILKEIEATNLKEKEEKKDLPETITKHKITKEQAFAILILNIISLFFLIFYVYKTPIFEMENFKDPYINFMLLSLYLFPITYTIVVESKKINLYFFFSLLPIFILPMFVHFENTLSYYLIALVIAYTNYLEKMKSTLFSSFIAGILFAVSSFILRIITVLLFSFVQEIFWGISKYFCAKYYILFDISIDPSHTKVIFFVNIILISTLLLFFGWLILVTENEDSEQSNKIIPEKIDLKEKLDDAERGLKQELEGHSVLLLNIIPLGLMLYYISMLNATMPLFQKQNFSNPYITLMLCSTFFPIVLFRTFNARKISIFFFFSVSFILFTVDLLAPEKLLTYYFIATAFVSSAHLSVKLFFHKNSSSSLVSILFSILKFAFFFVAGLALFFVIFYFLMIPLFSMFQWLLWNISLIIYTIWCLVFGITIDSLSNAVFILNLVLIWMFFTLICFGAMF